MDDTELDSSELGTKTYWEEAYKREITNFDEHGDRGDVWFGEDSAYRVIKWVKSNLPLDIGIIDLGCGNGFTLMELAREGFTNLLGVDYCEEAIMLAKKVAHQEYPAIQFKIFDVTDGDVSALACKFGLVLDKGTYDAICLNPDNAKRNRELYLESVYNMLQDSGIFVITSCNWTEEELIKQFSEKLRLKQVIPTPQFKFGGKIGSVVTSIVFEK